MIDFLIVIFSIKNDGKNQSWLIFWWKKLPSRRWKKSIKNDGKKITIKKSIKNDGNFFHRFFWLILLIVFFIEVLLIFFWFWLIFQYVCVAWLAFFIVVSMCLRIEMESETKKFTLWRLPSWRKMCARVCILYSISVAISTASFSLSSPLGVLGTRYGSTQKSLVSETHFYCLILAMLVTRCGSSLAVLGSCFDSSLPRIETVKACLGVDIKKA